MRIGQVAKLVGVSVETIRFYEKQRLIPVPQRNDSGYREYPETVIERLTFICRAKDLGFSLKEVKELLSLGEEANATCAEVKQRTELKIIDVDKRIEDLTRIKQGLLGLISFCPGQGPVSECPIIKTLAERK